MIKVKGQREKVKSYGGFTLIEMVIVIALVAIASMVLADMFVSHNRLYRTQTAELNVTGDARTALDDIDSYVRQANRTMESYSTYTAGSQVLILQIQSINSSKQLISATYDYVVYYLVSGSLYRQVIPNAASTRTAVTKKIANNVTALTFTYNDANYPQVTKVTTDMTLLENAGIQNRTISISSQASLRSY